MSGMCVQHNSVCVCAHLCGHVEIVLALAHRDHWQADSQCPSQFFPKCAAYNNFFAVFPQSKTTH